MNNMIYDKYIDETGEMLNEIAMNGFEDSQCGDVQTNGMWTALILEHNAIIQEDDQGFFDYKIFDTEQEAQKNYDRIQSGLEVRWGR